MDRTESFFAFLHDARIAPHAAGNLPAWLWSADGGQILFANAVGAAIFGGDNVAAVLEKRFDRVADRGDRDRAPQSDAET